MASDGKERLFSGDLLHQSVDSYLCEQLQGLTIARTKLVQVEQHIQNLMQERENILYEIEIRQANVEHTQKTIAESRGVSHERWLDIRKRYNLIGGEPCSLISLLPTELLVCILKLLTPSDLRKTMMVNKCWSEVSSSDVVWRHTFKTLWGEMDEYLCESCHELSPMEDKARMMHAQLHDRDNCTRRSVTIGNQRVREAGGAAMAVDDDDHMAIDEVDDNGCNMISKEEKKVSWKSAFAHRRWIEGNWTAGRYSMHTLTGHTDWVTCIATYQSRLISGSFDALIKVWNMKTKECVVTLSGHTEGINDLDLNPYGSVCVSGSLDCTLRIWDLTTYKCVWTLEGHTDQVSFSKFSHHPGHVVSASLDGSVRVWNISSGKCTAVLEGHSSGVTAMCMHGIYAVTGSADGAIIVWDVANGRSAANLAGHTDRITSMHSDIKYNRVASASWDFTVRVWDIGTGACLRVLTGHIFRLKCVDLCGDTVVSGGWDNEAKVWDLRTGKCIETFSGHTSYIWATQLLLRRKRVVTGSWDHSIRMWDIASGKSLYTLEHTSEVLCMQANSHRLIGASKDIRVWDFSVLNT